MPYPFVPGEILTSVNLNNALDMRMLSSGTGMGLIPGGVAFGHATNGGFQTDYQNLFYDDVNDRFGVGTNTPQVLFHVGKTAASLRSYNQWYDAANNAWTYLGDWTKFAGVATYGTEAIGAGVVADVALIRGGTEYLRLNSNYLLASRGLSFGNVIAPLGATDTSRHITLWESGYGFSITGGTLNYITGGQHHFIGTGTSIAQLMAGGTYINVPLIVQPTSTTAYPLEIIDLGTNGHSVLRIRNTPSGWGLAFDPFWPGVSFNSYHDGVNKKAFSNDFSGAFFLNPANGTLTFSSGNAPGAGLPVVETDRLSITATGFIGINHFTPAPAQNLAVRGVGGLGATVRSYRIMPTALDGEWAYMGDWLGNVARYGTDKNGTGQVRNVEIMVGGVNKLDYGTTGGTMNNPTAWSMPDGQLRLASTVINYGGIQFHNYWNGSGFVFSPGTAGIYSATFDFDSSTGEYRWWSSWNAGNAGDVAGMIIGMKMKRNPSTGGMMLTLGDWPDWSASFPMLRRNGTAFEVRLSDDSAYGPLGTATITITALGSSVANSNNYGLNVTAITAASSAAGSITNRGIQITVPTGGATVGSTSNTGISIAGAGGTAAGGTVSNWAIFSNSAATSFFLAPIIIGNTTSSSGISVAGLTGHGLTLSTQSGQQARLVIVKGGANPSPPQLFFAKGRGLNGLSSGIVQNNDILLEIGAVADDASVAGAFPVTAAYHRAEVDGAVSTGIVPARFTWLTMGTAGGAAVERLRITANGLLTFGGATASFPALRRNGTSLEARLADDSAYTQFRASAFYGDTLFGAAESFTQAQWTMSAGSITWAGSRLSWAGRMIIIPVGIEAAGSGYFQFNQPVTPIPASQVYDGLARSVTGGVLLNAWEALYAECPVGGIYTSAIYRIVAYPINPGPPSNWILIATHSGDTGALKLGTGTVLRAGDTVSAGGVTTQYVWNNNGAPQPADISISQTYPTGGIIRNYITYADSLNNEFAYMGEWFSGAAYYGTGKLGTGVLRDVYFQRGGINYLILTSGAVTVPPQLRLTVGDTLAMTNIARTFYVRDQVTGGGLGTTAGSYVYPFEFVYSASNLQRLQITGYRRAAGTTWNDAGWRIQTAVDSSFTTGTQTYLELTNVGGGGRVFLGVDGTDTLTLSRAAFSEISGAGQFNATGPTNGYQWADRGTGALRSWYATGSASILFCNGADRFWIYDSGVVKTSGLLNVEAVGDSVFGTVADGYNGIQLRSNNKHWLLSKRHSSDGDAFHIWYHNGTAYAGAPFFKIATDGVITVPVQLNIATAGSVGSLRVQSTGGTGSQTSLWLEKLTAPTDQKRWEMLFRTDGQLEIRSINDAYSVGAPAILFERGAGVSHQRTYLYNVVRYPQNGGSSYMELFDDGNSHIEANVALWLNSYTGGTINTGSGDFNFGGDIFGRGAGHQIWTGKSDSGYGQAMLNQGSTTNTGYIAWWKPNNTRQAYMGWENGGLRLQILQDGPLRIASGGGAGLRVDGPGASYGWLRDDGNTHLSSEGAGLYLNWNGNGVTTGGTLSVTNITMRGNYAYFASGTGDVNAYGGPFVYSDANTMVFHCGTGNAGFAFQDLNGSTVAYITSNGRYQSNGRDMSRVDATHHYLYRPDGGVSLYLSVDNGTTNYYRANHHTFDHSDGTVRMVINSVTGRVDINGQLWMGADIIIPNSSWYYGKNTSGTPVNILSMTNDDHTHLGHDSYNTNLHGSWMYVHTHMTPTSDNTHNLGSITPLAAYAAVCYHGLYNASDRSLKRDIADLPDCLGLVEAITPRRYRYTDALAVAAANRTGKEVHWGFIADEVGDAMRDAGHGGERFGGFVDRSSDDGAQALNYNELVSVLWKAVQELTGRLKTLEEKYVGV